MRLGPVLGISVIVNDLAAALDFYRGHLGLSLVARDKLVLARALALGEAGLAAAATASMRLPADLAITLIEAPQARARDPEEASGWIGLRLELPSGPGAAVFADGVCTGPGGERIVATAGIGDPRLSAVVLGCADRVAARAFYAGLGLLDGATADASGRLQGGQRIEFVEGSKSAIPDPTLRTGIRLVSFARSDARGQRLRGRDDPSARILGGAEGEGVELV